MTKLQIKNMEARAEDTDILHDINLDLKDGEVTAIMGPNGSGKSTLAKVLMGHPEYEAEGDVLYKGEDLLEMEPDERSRDGVFLSFQYPAEIPGVTVSNFLRTAINARREDEVNVSDHIKNLNENLDLLGIPREFGKRYLNEGFSGGEKKKMEILQMAMLEPDLAILDETDSGLDIDSLKNVCNGIQKLKERDPDMTILIITHYQRVLEYLEPDRVCIMKDGTIVEEGTASLAQRLEEEGYESF